MSTSKEVVERLLAAGMTKAEIAREIGRDSSVVSQITSGRKPYANLTPTLEAIEQKRAGRTVEVPEAPRRLDKQGNIARVRRPTGRGRTISVGSKGTIKSGARSILNRLRKAAADGQLTAWTLVFPNGVVVGKSPKAGKNSHHRNAGAPNVADFGGVPADEMLAFVNAAGGNVPLGVVRWLVAQNRLEDDSVMPVSIEMRTYDAQ